MKGQKSKLKALIVGGTSGLGLDLARKLSNDYNVVVTGRHDPKERGVAYLPFDIAYDPFSDIQFFREDILYDVSPLDLLVYSAGFYQGGKIDSITDEEIVRMANVGFTFPAMMLSSILEDRGNLPNFIAITSTSQYTPRELEPVYSGVKAGLGMLAESLSLDERFGKTLVVAPGGMNTRFWDSREVDRKDLLDTKWVAEQVLNLNRGVFRYRFAKILRDPPRVEIVKTN